MTDQAYPLQWPIGWPRTPSPSRAKFSEKSVSAALTELHRQLGLLRASEVVISSNVSLGNQSPKDKGVCVYFKLKASTAFNAPVKPYALPCDKWDKVEHNIWALAMHIDSLRSQARWGVGTIERQFAGYAALPAPMGANPEEWWKVFGCNRDIPFDEAQRCYRNKAVLVHPDRGGTADAMALVNAAWAACKRSYGQ